MKLLLSIALSLAAVFNLGAAETARKVRVLVWDEQQPAQQQVYSNFLGNAIADHLRKSPDLSVKSAFLDQAGQGLADLDNTDVLIWWGHQRHNDISVETAKDIVRRVKEGKLSLISLHSAHWSQPFVEAMNERSRMDVLNSLLPSERASVTLHETNLFTNFRTPPRYTSIRTPSALLRKPTNGPVEIFLTLPNCCFPAYRGDGAPSEFIALKPGHPIAAGLPERFTIAHTEMYDEPFHVPAPDEVLFEERWAGGEWFRSGSLWNLGKGKVFYFRPGHEIYPVFKDENVLKLLENAARFLGRELPR